MSPEYIKSIGIKPGDVYISSSGSKVTVLDTEFFADRGDVVIADEEQPRRIDAWKLHACRYTKVEPK